MERTVFVTTIHSIHVSGASSDAHAKLLAKEEVPRGNGCFSIMADVAEKWKNEEERPLRKGIGSE